MSIYNWSYNGTLDAPLNNQDGGVYLLIFKGNPKRIIYVGTTNCFNRRYKQHKKGYLEGNRTVWKVSSTSEDIYELMSCQGQSSKSKRFNYYASLAKKGKLWAHTTLEKEITQNELNKKDDFIKNWKSYVSNFFIKNIEIWSCTMYDDEERILALESKIQRSFKTNYNIESYINNHGMCFLGKIEFTGDVSKYKYTFRNYPDLDNKCIVLLKSFPNSKIIVFNKNINIQKKILKDLRINQARLTNPNSFTKWEKLEDKVVINSRRLGINIETIANEYLKGTEKEVHKRIKYLERYYRF